MLTQHAPAIEIDETGITVNYLRIEDPTAREYLATFEEAQRAEVVGQAASLGLRCLQAGISNGSVIAMTDQLQTAAKAATENVNAATQTLERSLKALVDRYCSEDGVLANNLRKIGGEALDPDKAEMVVRLRERIAKDMQIVFEPLAKQLRDTVNVNDPNQPFGAMARDIKATLESLVAINTKIDHQSALVAMARGNPHTVGRSLEDFTLQTLGEVAAYQGETLEDVRDVPGLVERSKAGDIVSTIDGRFTPGATVKVVIEDKNRRSATATGLLTELDRAMANRGASVALGIMVNPNAPPIFYQGKKVLVNLSEFGTPAADYGLYAELLRVGYDMARFMGIAAARVAHLEPTIDLEAINGDTDNLIRIAGKFSNLKDNHTRIETAVKNARETADEIRQEIVVTATRLRKRITDTLKQADAEAA